jgi:glyoxylase-like metal-dependent hydrolase (beta-lactamase superfamily II)
MALRKNLLLTVVTILSLFAFTALAFAQQQPAPLKVMPLTGSVYWASGGAGSNTGFVVGRNGVVVIDAKMTVDSAKEFLVAIAKVTPKPVTHVILTHSDADHVNGLAGFPAGLTIVATDKCKEEMEESANGPNPRMAAPKDYMPTQLVTKSKNITFDGVHLRLLHFAPAHTSGDLIVYLPDQKIVFTGDIVALQTPYPIIHLEKHGSSEGWITTMKGILALNIDTVVPGHGDVQMGKEVLQKRLADTEERRAKIQELVQQGKSLDEIKAVLGEPTAPAQGGGLRFPTFTEVVYQELTKKS